MARAKQPSISFAAKFKMEREAQGAGGTFTWKDQKYTTNYAEEEKSPGKLKRKVKRTVKKAARKTKRTERKATRKTNRTARQATRKTKRTAMKAARKTARTTKRTARKSSY
tara:strand:+ start:977 stop:1309 length:333 start_codon:yes stop_codon:yes gene_type:complete